MPTTTQAAAPATAETENESRETSADSSVVISVDGERTVPSTTDEITVDGRLDERAWNEALSMPLPYETRPGENTPAPVETEVLLTHDVDRLYIAFRAHDPEPEKIRARLTDRDTAWNDDFVGVVLDTFNDERRAFELFANPLGAQMDLFYDDVNRNEDASWDAIWDSAGRITDTGYIVEMAIPFYSLSFPRTRGVQSWGFDAIRFWPRRDRVRISLTEMDRDRNCYLCQLDEIQGFAGISPGRNIEIIPTLTAGRTDERAEFPAGELEDGDVESELGLTAGWGITPNLTLQGTVNPDFSQVEADAGQLDVNTQFTLFFPERRPFFLEGADFFETPFDAVFTRTVSDPVWGLKLTGKEGRHGIGTFVAEDEVTSLVFPGSQRSRSMLLDEETLDTAVRYRTDFGERSSAVGLLVTSREGDAYHNRVGGFDGLYRFGDSDSLIFQGLVSETSYPESVVRDFGQPTGSFTDEAYRIEYRHSARNWFWRGSYEDVGEGFRADMGFMPQVGYSKALGGLERIWHGEDSDWYNTFRLGGDVDRTEDERGGLLEEELEVWVNYQGPRESGLWVGPGTRNKVFNGVEFDQTFVNWSGWIQAMPDLFLNVWGGAGDAIDFAHIRPGDQLRLGLFTRYNLGRHVRATLSHDFRTLDVEGGELFRANLSRLRTVYQINLRTFVRAIVEYTDIDRDPSLYADPVDAESEDVFTQLLFSYKINPQTVAFLGYSDIYLGDQDVQLTQSNRSLFLKLGYSWNI